MYGIQTVTSQVSSYLPVLEERPLAIEIMDFGKDLNCPISELKAADAPVKERLYAMHAPFVDQCLCSLDAAVREYSRKNFESSLNGAIDLSIPNIVLHHNIFPTLSPRSSLFNELLNGLLDYLYTIQQRTQLTFFIENVLDPTPDVLHGLMLRNDNKHIKVCFDVAHAALSKVGVVQWAERLAPWIGHVHLADTLGFFDEHLPCGFGCIDWSCVPLTSLLAKEGVVGIFETANVTDTLRSLDRLEKFNGNHETEDIRI